MWSTGVPQRLEREREQSPVRRDQVLIHAEDVKPQKRRLASHFGDRVDDGLCKPSAPCPIADGEGLAPSVRQEKARLPSEPGLS